MKNRNRLIVIYVFVVMCFLIMLCMILCDKFSGWGNAVAGLAIIGCVMHLLSVIKELISRPEINLNCNFSVGFGYDVHKLENNVPLILCGTKINHSKGLVSFSDGDVVTHALVDALLGAAGLADIGTHFPSSNDEFKNISSLDLLRKTMELLEQKQFKIANVDLTIVAEKPVLQPFVVNMKSTLLPLLKISDSRINIKITTEEGLGFTGKELGISSYCVVLLQQTD